MFGDLHLEHIVNCRQQELGQLGYELEFPLLYRDYEILSKDLERSGVPCVISDSTVVGVHAGELYDYKLREKAAQLGLDVFGERGEFHSVARVWEVKPNKALGVE